ncbi:hypothetical protein RFI_36029 [Reticulomyxa filosa]|uniref:Uncharacterized protein n=1 Tax=Reticulomyxa filosa TaxID=46433 RepID=X6LHK3_RETFI|nr:hypothetical protein RFI_36029 [Reticulomyxa filosa]|eukprot:ETO01413.1 hypothetical protein RFI_36029 [Reticulomyxa filosa]
MFTKVHYQYCYRVKSLWQTFDFELNKDLFLSEYLKCNELFHKCSLTGLPSEGCNDAHKLNDNNKLIGLIAQLRFFFFEQVIYKYVRFFYWYILLRKARLTSDLSWKAKKKANQNVIFGFFLLFVQKYSVKQISTILFVIFPWRRRIITDHVFILNLCKYIHKKHNFFKKKKEN